MGMTMTEPTLADLAALAEEVAQPDFLTTYWALKQQAERDAARLAQIDAWFVDVIKWGYGRFRL